MNIFHATELHLKTMKMVNFMSVYFYHNKKFGAGGMVKETKFQDRVILPFTTTQREADPLCGEEN